MSIIENYPLNVVVDLFGEEETYRVYIPGVLDEISKLSQRQAEIIRLRYKEKKTLKECGILFGVGQERIRQLQNSSLRQLRNPNVSKYFFVVPKAEYDTLYEKYNRLLEEYASIKQISESSLSEKLDTKSIKEIADAVDLLQSPISELGLSNRSYNALKRSGKNTIKDVIDMTFGDLYRIRNMGEKSAEEVKAAVERKGLNLLANKR